MASKWSYGDPKCGVDVPMCIRRSGATGPPEKRELGGNGVTYTNQSFTFECRDCGVHRRFATSEFMTQYWCDECGDVRWFAFRWELNRPDGHSRDVDPVYTWCDDVEGFDDD